MAVSVILQCKLVPSISQGKRFFTEQCLCSTSKTATESTDTPKLAKVHVSDTWKTHTAYSLNSYWLPEELNVHVCVNVHTHILSNRATQSSNRSERYDQMPVYQNSILLTSFPPQEWCFIIENTFPAACNVLKAGMETLRPSPCWELDLSYSLLARPCTHHEEWRKQPASLTILVHRSFLRVKL